MEKTDVSREKIKGYGEMFASLREQRHFLLTDFKEVGLSAAALSRFENDGTVLRYDKLDAALELMKIEVGEFEYFTNGFQSDYYIDTCNAIEEAYYRQDKVALQAIYEESSRYHYPLIALATKNLLGELAILEKSIIRDRLFAITDWSYFELSILSFVVEQLTPAMRDSILKDFLKNNFHYMEVPKYREKIFQVLCRAAIGEINGNQKQRARALLDRVKSHLQTKDLLPRCAYLLAEGLWKFKFENPEIGLSEMKKVVEIFQTMDDQVLADFCQMLIKQETHRYKSQK